MCHNNVAVVIAAYNEGKVIDDVLIGMLRKKYLIILVDDGSTDETYSIASKYPIHLLRHSFNLGQGAALQTGINYALKLGNIDIIVTFDADGQHEPEEISRLISPILTKKCDVVLGSRFLEKNHAINISAYKELILKIAVLYTNFLTGLNISDTHNGLRAFSRYAANQINITQNGMAHASQILSQIAKKKLRFQEVPVTIKYSEYSKMKGQPILNIINIIWDMFFKGID